MHDIVTIAPFQKATSFDVARNGQLAREAMTDQTRQFLKRGLAWADFTFTYANGGYVVNVGIGDLWKDGGQYRSLAIQPIDLVALAPPSDGLKRIVSLVAFANPARDDAPENREFAVVVTPATPTAAAVYQTETRQTATLNRQIASVSKVAGDLAPQPTPPVLSSDLCEIARVVLTKTGIESVTPNLDTRAPNLGDLSGRVDGVQDFVDGQGRRIDTLDKNLAALGARIPVGVSDAVLRQYAQNLAALNQATKVKTGDLAYGTDYGLDLSQTDNSYAGYAAAVEDGIRFPWVSSKETPLTLFTPNDPITSVISNLLLPAFTEEARLTVEGKDGTLSISSQVSSTVTAVKVEIPRTAVRAGPSFTVCTNSAFWATGSYDAATQIFKRNGETFQVTSIDPGAIPGGGHDWVHGYQIYVDQWTDTRWDRVVTQIGLNGAVRGQSFRVPDFGYLSSIDLPFTTVDSAFGVTLMLCETKADGSPNLNRVLERSDLAAGAATASADGSVRTKFVFRPAYVRPGKLYAWVTVTRGNYALATVSGNKFAEGTSFLTTDGGGFFQGDPLVDFAFTANFARFASPRVEIRLNDADNVNGDPISALKYLYGAVVPTGCRIVHMVKRSGSDWVTVAEVNTDKSPQSPVVGSPFATAPLPVSVQQKIVLVGTTTLMPAIDLTQAWVTTLRLGTVRDHFTPVINLGTSCNRAEVEVVVDGPFDPANHTTACRLIVGGAVVTPASTSFVDDPAKPGRRIYTYGFSFTAATSLRIELPGTLTSNLSTYHVERRFFRAWLV